MSNELSDKELVEGMINNNHDFIRFFFFEKCTSMFYRINQLVYDKQANINDLINELYLYLQADDWRKLRRFDNRVQLSTWTSVIAVRFFGKKSIEMMKIVPIENIQHELQAKNIEEQILQKLDVKNLLNLLPNQRDQFVLRKLYLEDIEPKVLADEMGITVDNLYNIKRRALQKLFRIVGNEKNN
jgi:DNA-directed RNA polymerase specialized sigma24 family protein